MYCIVQLSHIQEEEPLRQLARFGAKKMRWFVTLHHHSSTSDESQILCRKEINYLKMSQKEREQLHAEFSILSSLHHPNIVGYYHREHHKQTQELYLYMEYCGGGDLGSVIKELKRTGEFAKEEFVWRILSQLVTALYRCHYGIDAPDPGSDMQRQRDPRAALKSKNQSMMILHRDLKPENIFLGDDQSVKLGDFGLSKLMQSHDFASTYVGTPFYMSPEICAAEKYTLHSDIWALGCIMYELCTKEPPFNAKTHLQLVQKIRKGDFKPLPAVYSADLQNVIANCLKVNPLHRPDTAALLTIPYVWIARKGKEMVDFGKLLKLKEETAIQKLQQAEERLSALEADKVTMATDIEATVRREWEVKARLEIDRQVQMELERLRKKFDKEVEEKVQMLVSKQSRVDGRVLREIQNPPTSNSTENVNYQSSVNTAGEEDFPSSTDLTDLSELSIHSPAASVSKPLPTKRKAAFARSKTTFDSPADVNMGEPSPMSISSLALSPRRNAAAQAANEAGSKNIFAEAARQKAKWEPTLAYASDEDDDIPDLPSPTRPKVAPADPFKVPARPGLLRQNTTASMQKLTTQPTLFPSISNTAAVVRAATASALPRTVTEPDLRPPPGALKKSPSRRLSKIPSSTKLSEDANSPTRKQGKENGEDIYRAAMQRNIPSSGGRTLVELAQARAGGRPLSMDVGKGIKLTSEKFERDLSPVPVWDPERDEMPSPFLVRSNKVVRGLR